MAIPTLRVSRSPEAHSRRRSSPERGAQNENQEKDDGRGDTQPADNLKNNFRRINFAGMCASFMSRMSFYPMFSGGCKP